MDKVLSARIDESVWARVDRIARLLHRSKKYVLEQAITRYADEITGDAPGVLRETSGAWRRKEKPAQTVEHTRQAFRKSFTRRAR